MNYTPLYIKTDYSLLESLIKIDDLIMFAKENNLKSLSITDNNMCGVIEFYNKCLKNNIKPIIGLNLNIEDKNIILYAKNYDGYINLIHINTLIEENQLNIDNINKYSDNIICILPLESRILKDKLSFVNIYIGFKNKEEEKEITEEKIYIKEILYLKKEDSKYLNYLIAIKNNYNLQEKETDNYLYLEETLDYNLTNNYKLYDLCNVELKFKQELIPKYNCPDNLSSYEYLKKICIQGLKNIFGDKVGSKYIDRLKYELEIINEMNFCDYFLIVWDYVKYAKENNILVGPGRGSASGSLVSYCLNIIEIDPLKYNLLFERFLNKDRTTMPDIDIDFDGERIEEVIDYCKNKYGRKNVTSILTYSSLTTKQVIKDIGKILKIDDEMIDYFSKMFKSKSSLKENYDIYDNIKNHIIKNPELKKLYEICLKLENIKKHISIHASGVIISKKEIDEVIPLVKYREDYLTGYQAEYLENIGLIKMDFLSLKTLTSINEIISNIKGLDYKKIPLNDKKTIELFYKANTLGIFQFESTGMINFLKKFKPVSFEEIYNIMALYRPGPMNNIEHYIKRKNHLEEVDYFDESLENILKPTYGIIVYQEQIMQIANIMASYTLGEADILRRAMSKKKEDILLKEKEKFITRTIQNGYNSELSNKIYDLILKFAEYGFPKAHAVAYSIISYKMAYLKVHYPLEFMKNMLDNAIGSKFDTKERIVNAKENGIKIHNPDINISTTQYEIKDDYLVYPLVGIKDINIMAINNIVLAREKGLFKDIFDFLKRVDFKIINKDTLVSLIYIGAFDSFNMTRKTLIENLDIILNYIDLVKDLNDDSIGVPNIVEYDEYSHKEIMNFEYMYLNMYLNKHPVTEYRKKYNRPITINSVSNYLNKRVSLIAKVDRTKEYVNKKQELMCFMNVTDEYGMLECTLFNDVYGQAKNIKIGDIVFIQGKINRRDGRDKMLVNNIKVIDEN